MTIERIVLAVGNTDRRRATELADAAAEVAGPNRATVHVVHAFSRAAFERRCALLDYDGTDPPDPGTVAKRSTAVRAVLRRLTDATREYGFPVEVHGVIDDAEAAVPAFVERVGADLLVVGGRRRSPAGKAAFGSTAQSLLLSAPVPVTFVPGEPDASSAGDDRAATAADPPAGRVSRTDE